jgi:hypothetical protein
LPDWLAVIEHVPAATRVMAVPETVQIDRLLEVNETGRPEVAVAVNTGGFDPSVWVLSAPKPIVCGVGFTVNVWVTVGAAA